MNKSRSSFDTAYRRGLGRYYYRLGFAEPRRYRDASGFTYSTPPCYYCGVPAATEDHTTPLVLLAQLVAQRHATPAASLLHVETLAFASFPLVPACWECNGALGEKVFDGLDERVRYVKQWLRERYRNVLSLPVWTPEEREELGYALQVSLRGAMELQKVFHERLAWNHKDQTESLPVSRVPAFTDPLPAYLDDIEELLAWTLFEDGQDMEIRDDGSLWAGRAHGGGWWKVRQRRLDREQSKVATLFIRYYKLADKFIRAYNKERETTPCPS